MASRFVRVLLLMAGAGVTVCVLVFASGASRAGATAGRAGDRGLLARCAKNVLGIGGPGATPVAGSADPQVISQLAIFRRTRSPNDALPAASGLRVALAFADARTYDPSAAVRLTRNGAVDAVYAVPVAMSARALPANCAGLPHFAGAGAFLAFQAEESGSGPGACLISTRLEERLASGPPLPGMKSPKPTKTPAITGVACKSDALQSGYTGALGDPLLGSGTHLALIPDGVGTITYTLDNGRQLTVPVAGNIARPPAALSLPAIPHPLTAPELSRLLFAHLPTTVTESGVTGTSPPATLARPVSLIPDAVRSFSFLKGLVGSRSGIGSSSATGFGSVSCSARTHRCLAVSVTTTCDSHERCRTRRTIERYRYVGGKPPPGTTRQTTLPTTPIIARVNRVVVAPRRLTLVLSGVPHPEVVVLLSVSCFSRNAAASSGAPVLKLAVPSRTRIALPGRARSFHACDVGALVTSSRPGPVHVTVAGN